MQPIIPASIDAIMPESGVPPSDNLADYVSYADIVDKLKARAASTRHTNLVETLAEEVVELALADPRVASVVADVRKTEIIPEAKGVGVIIHRQRGSMGPDCQHSPAFPPTRTRLICQTHILNRL